MNIDGYEINGVPATRAQYEAYQRTRKVMTDIEARAYLDKLQVAYDEPKEGA